MGKTTELLSLTGDESPGLPILPDELIFEILLRLPVRSLLQFKCVCKSWKTLISHPQFAKDHLRTSTANPNRPHQRLVCPNFGFHKILSFSVQSLLQNLSNPSKPLSFWIIGDSYIILGSCNGLLCLCDSLLSYIKLWNPSIGLISKTMSTGISNHLEFITHRGFGYDHVNDKYKLLVVLESRYHETEIVTKIYTFGSNSCKVIQNFRWRPAGRIGKFVKGTLNWLSMRGDQWVIFSFDLGTERCGELLLPDWDGLSICIPVLNVLRDCLCVSFFQSKEFRWVVWLMKEYGVQDSWTKLMMIPHFVEGDWTWTKLMRLPLDSYGFRSYITLDLLCISEDGVVMLIPNRSLSKVVLFNLNNGRWDCVTISSNLGFHIYYESLVSPPWPSFILIFVSDIYSFVSISF